MAPMNVALKSRFSPLLLAWCACVVLACGPPESREGQPARETSAGIVQAAPSLQWSFAIGKKLPETMLLEGDEVLLADSKGDLLAVSTDDGSQRTVIHLPGPIMGWDKCGDLVASSAIDKHIHLNSAGTGEELWSTACETTPGEPTLSHDAVIFAEGLGPYRVRCHSTEDGSVIWIRAFDTKPSGYAPVIGDEMVFVAFEDGLIRAFHLEKGQTIWEFAVGKPLELDPEGRWEGRYDFLGEEGEQKQRLSPIHPGGIGRMLICSGRLVVPSEDGYVRCISPANGNVEWDLAYDERIIQLWKGPGANPRLYCDTAEGRFIRVDPENGKALADIRLDNPTLGCIFLKDGRLIIDYGEEEGAMLRSAVDFTALGQFDIGVIPVSGIETDGILVVRTRDGRIAGINMGLLKK